MATSTNTSLNFMLSVIKGIEPKDQLETILAAAVHIASVRSARPLRNASSFENWRGKRANCSYR